MISLNSPVPRRHLKKDAVNHAATRAYCYSSGRKAVKLNNGDGNMLMVMSESKTCRRFKSTQWGPIIGLFYFLVVSQERKIVDWILIIARQKNLPLDVSGTMPYRHCDKSSKYCTCRLSRLHILRLINIVETLIQLLSYTWVYIPIDPMLNLSRRHLARVHLPTSPKLTGLVFLFSSGVEVKVSTIFFRYLFWRYEHFTKATNIYSRHSLLVIDQINQSWPNKRPYNVGWW